MAVPPSQTQNCQPSLWDQALNQLPKDQKLALNLSLNIQRNKRSILDSVLEVVNEKQRLCLEKRWKFKNRQGQTIIVRDLLDKIAHYLQKFVDVGDVAVQFDPIHAVLPWAGIRLLLKVVYYFQSTLNSSY